ncbi:MAG: ABC transporter substrate-binding protein [Gammaproteobacteria bacterium]
MNRRLILILTLGLAACAPPPAPPLRLGTFVAWPGYAPLYLAQELGFYKDTNVRLVDFSSATQLLRAFRNGAVDAATLTLDEALLLNSQGHNPHIVLVLDISHGADAILGRRGLKTLADLRGKRVGVEVSALGALMLARGLESAGLTLEDVTVVPVPADEFVMAYTTGQVDAIVCYEPHMSKLLAQGAVKLFDSTAIPGEIFDVMLAREDVLKNQLGKELVKLVNSWFQALEYLRTQPDDAYVRIGKRLHLSVADTRTAFQGLTLVDYRENLRYLTGERPALLAPATYLYKIMQDRNLIDNPVNLKTIIFPDILIDLNDK